jgi:hypothetical protein
MAIELEQNNADLKQLQTEFPMFDATVSMLYPQWFEIRHVALAKLREMISTAPKFGANVGTVQMPVVESMLQHTDFVVAMRFWLLRHETVSAADAKQLVADQRVALAEFKKKNFPATTAAIFQKEATEIIKSLNASTPAILVRLVNTGQCVLFETGMFAATRSCCHRCGTVRGIQHKRCGRCHIAWYCSGACQLADWTHHKPNCKATKAVVVDHAIAMLTDDLPVYVLHMNQPKFKTYFTAPEKFGAQCRDHIIKSARAALEKLAKPTQVIVASRPAAAASAK